MASTRLRSTVKEGRGEKRPVPATRSLLLAGEEKEKEKEKTQRAMRKEDDWADLP